ncbi:hypothetical protein ONZ45_g7251 [Pleurotus djamor]|nr:hypothetical protein ONZ45_g7251 [Pleurotus djamor]
MDHPIRLFDTETQEFTEGCHPYAILSHRWATNEPRFKQIHGKEDLPPPTSKFMRFCVVARERYGCRYVWADSVCIDQDNLEELNESIPSMFAWYQNAEICIVYLQDVDHFDGIWQSAWFTRGWTLQELLAPRKVAFFYRDWARIDFASEVDIDRTRPNTFKTTRSSVIHRMIPKAAGLPRWTITSSYIPSPHNLEQVLKWAEKRQTTVPQDAAYSLVSLLGVCLPTHYGWELGNVFVALRLACHHASQAKKPSEGLRFSIESVSRDKTQMCEEHRSSSSEPVIVQLSGQGPSEEFLKLLPQRHLVFTTPPGVLKPSTAMNMRYALYKELESRHTGPLRMNDVIPFVVVDESIKPREVVPSKITWCHDCCCDPGSCCHTRKQAEEQPERRPYKSRFQDLEHLLRPKNSDASLESLFHSFKKTPATDRSNSPDERQSQSIEELPRTSRSNLRTHPSDSPSEPRSPTRSVDQSSSSIESQPQTFDNLPRTRRSNSTLRYVVSKYEEAKGRQSGGAGGDNGSLSTEFRAGREGYRGREDHGTDSSPKLRLNVPRNLSWGSERNKYSDTKGAQLKSKLADKEGTSIGEDNVTDGQASQTQAPLISVGICSIPYYGYSSRGKDSANLGMSPTGDLGDTEGSRVRHMRQRKPVQSRM